jgi:uncharacterized ion transporter superfamily protein YfcC
MAKEQAPDTNTDRTDNQSSGEVAAKSFAFPQALTVLAIVLAVVWIAAFFIPSGSYELDENGGPVPGTYQSIENCSSAAEGDACIDKSPLAMFQMLWVATPNGLYGIEGDDGTVAAFNSGDLYGSAQIFLFVLAVGAFITVTMKTEAIELGIKRLALRFAHSPTLLIVILMIIFALGGTSYGMWEETLGFYTLMVALVIAMGMDKMVGVSIIFLGAGTGVLASTVNPFATGVASDAAGIAISDGLGLRAAMWVVLVAVAVLYVLRYAKRVKADHTKSIVGFDFDFDVEEVSEAEDVPKLSKKQSWVLVVFAATFITMIYGFIPWTDIWQNIFNADYPLFLLSDIFGDFYFTEASMLFLVGSVIVGMIGGLGEKGTVNTIITGAADFLGAALVIVLARGITVVMKNTFITDTILNWMEDLVAGTSSAVFSVVAFVVNIPIAFLVPSSSGHAALVMPIIAPLADFADVGRDIAVTAYQSASGLVNLITPTSAIIMGGLALAGVGYNKYVKFVLPYIGIMFVLVSGFLVLGTVIGG